MCLIFHNPLVESEPMVHAMVLGIGHYPHLEAGGSIIDLPQLPAASRSARAFCEWLLEDACFPVPLGSVRLLLVDVKETVGKGCTFEEVASALYEWRIDASRHAANISMFYYCGHGLQQYGDNTTLLLQGFGDRRRPLFGDTLHFRTLYEGMAPSTIFPNIARTQFYFLDVGSPTPMQVSHNLRGLMSPPLWDLLAETEVVDDRIAPIFQASSPGGLAYAWRDGKTLFTEALLTGLRGSAAEPTEEYSGGEVRWGVSINSLNRTLQTALLEFSKEQGVKQVPRLHGLMGNALICFLKKPPPGKALVFEDRLHSGCGAHALIIGISRYPHLPGGGSRQVYENLGLQQLSSAALTAYTIYQWLVANRDRLSARLTTIRLLIAPSEIELAAEPGLGHTGDRATLKNVLLAAGEWRSETSTHQDNLAFFYFAGHGAQRQSTEDAVMLLEDFGDGLGGLLRNAIDLRTLFGGMAPSLGHPRMAKTQLYFLDTCRVRPVEFKKYAWMSTTPVFSVEDDGTTDDRRAPVFYAAAPGANAYAFTNQLTVFGKALLESLGMAGAKGEDAAPSVVTIKSLDRALEAYIEEVNRKLTLKNGVKQDYVLGGLVKEAPILIIGGEKRPDASD